MTTNVHLSLDGMRPTAGQSRASVATRLRGVGKSVYAAESIRAGWQVVDAVRFVERSATDSQQQYHVERSSAGIVKRGRTQ